MAKKKAAGPTVDELEQLVIDIWNAAQECDGSRGSQQETLDSIQERIEALIPDVSDYETSDELGSEDDDEDDEE